MLLKNNAKRLIIINYKHDVKRNKDGEPVNTILAGQSWKLIPAGDPVDVPDEACEQDYVQELIEKNDLVIAATPKKKAEKKDDGEEKQQLRDELELLGVEVDSRWGVKKLKEKLAEAEEAAGEA